jgi:RND family efflux transporter MFP subunit
MPLFALGGLLLVIAFMAGLFNERIEPGVEERETSTDAKTHTVQLTREAATETVPASVEALEHTLISSRLLARVQRVTVRSGDVVEAGDLLVALEDEDLAAQSRQALEAVNSAEARMVEAERQRERAVALHERNMISDAERDAAVTAARSLEADLARARRRVEETEVAMSYAQLRAPIGGRIVERLVEPGDTVSPGQPMISLYNPVSLRVEAWVRESLALTLSEGDILPVEVPALQRRLDGTVEEIVPAANPGARAFMIRVRLPSGGALLPGMYARLAVPAGSAEKILIPEEALRRIGQLALVWVQGEAGVERRFVRTGTRRQDGQVEITAGLAVNDQVLLSPPAPSRGHESQSA